MTPIHLTPEAADKQAVDLVAPFAHLMTALEVMELEHNISLALRRESVATSLRAARYLAPLDLKEEIKQ